MNHGWSEHTAPDGRKYYYNSVTKKSVWVKPDELKTVDPAVALSQPQSQGEVNNMASPSSVSPESAPVQETCPWKEYTSKDNRKYYYNPTTKTSVWEMPQEYKDYLAKLAETDPSKTNPSTISSSASLTTPVEPWKIKAPWTSSKPKSDRDIFLDILKESGVKSDWSWDRALRSIIRHQSFHLLKTATERKQVFLQYVQERKSIDEEEEKKRNEQLESHFIALLNSRSGIGPFTSYKKACKLLQSEPDFMAIDSDYKRQTLYKGYMDDKLKQEKEEAKASRRIKMDRFAAFLRSLPVLERKTRWKSAQTLWKDLPEFYDDAQLSTLEPLDMLIVFEDHIRELERLYYSEKHEEKEKRRRQERKNREAFKELLEKLERQGLFHAKTKWKHLFELVEKEPAFVSLLGQPGSTPLDYFMDRLAELEDMYGVNRPRVEAALEARPFKFDLETSRLEEFRRHVDSLFATSNQALHPSVIAAYFFEKMMNLEREAYENKKREQKARRRKQDAFKRMLKHYDPPISSEASWEMILPLVNETSEFRALEEEHARKTFKRFIEKLKKREKRRRSSGDEGGLDKMEEGEEGEIGPDLDEYARDMTTSRRSSGINRSRDRHDHRRSGTKRRGSTSRSRSRSRSPSPTTRSRSRSPSSSPMRSLTRRSRREHHRTYRT